MNPEDQIRQLVYEINELIWENVEVVINGDFCSLSFEGRYFYHDADLYVVWAFLKGFLIAEKRHTLST